MRNLFFIITSLVFVISVGFYSCQLDEEGTLVGIFSVSDTRKVKFSSGNLQYNFTNHTWKFAKCQYDVIGETNSFTQNNFDGCIDLFAWGSANNPAVGRYAKDIADKFTDWGHNVISTGSNCGNPNVWRTLTTGEWIYLFTKRANATSLVNFATVENVRGIVILPDDWICPSGVTFNPLNPVAFNVTDFRINMNSVSDDNFKMNVYNKNQFEILESSGALFLPFCNNFEGGYWSSSDEGSFLSLTPACICPDQDCVKNAFLLNVRLVRNFED